MAVTLRQVVPFSITLGSAATSVTKTLTGGDIMLDITKSFLLWGCRGDSVVPQANLIQGRITSTTTIVFDREAHNSEVVEIFCYLCEFTAGVLVERGVILDSDFDGGTGGEFTVDLGAGFTSLATSFVFQSIIGVGAGATYDTDDMYTTYLTEAGGTVTLHAETGDLATADHDLAWEVIQYDDCAVQRGNFAQNDPATSTNVALSPSVDVAKSFINFSVRIANAGTDIGRLRLRGRHTINSVSGDQITIDRDHTAGANIQDIRWEVVEFTGSETVEEVLETFAAADGQEDATIAAVSSLTKAAVLSSYISRGGQSAYSANDNPLDSTFTAELTTVTNLQTKRGATNAQSLVAFYVIDFDPGAAGISIPVVQHHRAMQGVM